MLKALQILVLFLAVAFFLALAGLAYYSLPPPAYPSEQQTATQATEEQPHEKQHTFSGLINFLFPDAISIFTFWLVVATIVLGVIAYVQIAFLRSAEEISAKIAQAAKESAEAAKQAVTLSDKTAERQLRAYVGFKGVITITNVAQGQKPIIIAPVGNFGQTPAYKVAYSVDAKLLQIGTIFPEPIKVPGLRVVNPGSDGFEIHASMKNALTETEMTALENKQSAIYFFGEIVYFDIFSHRTRTIKFRLSHEKELLGSGRMGICEEGNEAD